MSKKQDSFYFDNFIACGEYACQAANLLRDIFKDFHPEQMEEWLERMHSVEHMADDKKHQLTDMVAKAFITPIEREDIINLSHYIDDLTDKLEEVCIRLYINNVQTIRAEAIQMIDIIIQCCEEVQKLLKEFPAFRHSKKLKEHIIRINSLEEEADKHYIKNLRNIHTKSNDIYEVLAWREIYSYLEKCADACEHIADSVESVVMKNS